MPPQSSEPVGTLGIAFCALGPVFEATVGSKGEHDMRSVFYCLTVLAASAAAFAADSRRSSQWTGERLACMECHAQLMNEFRGTGHGKAMEFGLGGRELDCGTCHGGDPARHMVTGKPEFITSQGKERSELVTAACMSCHATDKHVMFW